MILIDSGIPYRLRNIVFIGFMGVGKTTIGELVAKKLLRDFIDVDKEIEREFNMPISEIFKTIGEMNFREKEKETISNICTKQLQVISLGGGAFLQKEIREICLSGSVVFFLDITWSSWKERLNIIVDSRPVLHGRSLEEIEAMFYNRQEIYAMHNSKFNTDNFDAEEMANYITETIKFSWDLYDPQQDQHNGF